MSCATRPEHLFVSFDGAMYDTRNQDWSRKPPLRANYVCHHVSVNNVHDLKACLRAGSTTDVGGYPLFFITGDGSALSFDTVREHFLTCVRAYACADKDWCVVGCQINYEDLDLRCAHSDAVIPAAYGDDTDE